MEIDAVKLLERYIRARYPIIAINSFEENRVLTGIDLVVAAYKEHNNRDYDVYEWSFVTGFKVREKASEDGENKKRHLIEDGSDVDPIMALNTIYTYGNNVENASEVPATIFVMKDLHALIGDKSRPNPKIVRYLRDISARFEFDRHTLILTAPDFSVPSDLDKTIVMIDWPLPESKEMENILTRAESNLAKDFPVLLNGNRDQVTQAMLGLTKFEAESVLLSGIVATHELGDSVIPFIIKEKQQIIKKAGVLEYFDTNVSMQDVGGLKPLKTYAERKSAAFSTAARDFGLDAPRGLLLVGVPGTGKSLSAKAIAGMFRMPLLRMDVGALMGGLVGQSESNTRLALKTCEAIAPAVLWIDEIEKALGSSGEQDGGTSKRVLGTILTWMQERTSPVYIIATANDIGALQPELISRFNNVFFVDLPSHADRIEILKVHLLKRKQNPDNFDLDKCSNCLWGYSGREIETVVNTALEEAFYKKETPVTDHIINASHEIVPVSVTMEAKITAIRDWAERSQALRANDIIEKRPESAQKLSGSRKADL